MNKGKKFTDNIKKPGSEKHDPLLNPENRIKDPKREFSLSGIRRLEQLKMIKKRVEK